MKAFFFPYTLVLSIIFFASAPAVCQSTGYIVRQAASLAGRAVLDPNGDQYTSKTMAGFANDDVTNSEINFRSVPSYSSEPYGDLRRGPSHLYSDFVPDANNIGYYTYYDGANLLFRLRMGSLIPGAKGYSVMLDTDGKFGGSGANADPNYQPATTGTNGNPGFEIEIVLETNFRVAIYNVDGSSTPTLVKSYSNWQDMSQVSIAATSDNADPDFLLDFYVPFADLTVSPFFLTTSTSLRMTATTVMAPQAAIGGPKSDIYGLNDALYKTPNAQWEAFINAQPPITANTLITSGFSTMCTEPPVVNSPISAGTVTISGSWTKAALPGTAGSATISVYKNGMLAGSVVNVLSGAGWALNNILVTNNDVLTARAQATGESMCLVSNAVTVKSCTVSNRPVQPVLTCSNNYNKGVSGNNLSSGWTVYVENQTRGTVENSVSTPLQFSASGTTPNIVWNYAGGCSGGPNMPSGSYRIYYMNTSGCISEPVTFCLASGNGGSNNLAGTSATPVITTPLALTPGTKFISGTGEPSSLVRLYVDGEMAQSVTATSGGAFNFTNLSLTQGQNIYITNVLNTGVVSTSKCSAASGAYTVNCFTTPPLISVDENNQLIAGQPITGTSSEPVGTTVKVFTSLNLLVSTTSVLANGSWTTGATTAVAGTSYYAVSQNGTCAQSIAGSSFTSAANTTGRCGTITGPVTATSTGVSGTLTGALSGTTVRLYLDGTLLGSATTSNTFWGPIAISNLYPNGVLTIGVQESGKAEQSCPASETINCSASPSTPVIDPQKSVKMPGQTQTYTITNAVPGNYYALADSSTGASFGSAVYATSNSVTLSSNILQYGTYTLAIKSTVLSSASICTSPPAFANLLVEYNVLHVSTVKLAVRKSGAEQLLVWEINSEKKVSGISIEKSKDCRDYIAIETLLQSGNVLPNFFKINNTAALNQPSCYRLKVHFTDGSYHYSNSVAVKPGDLTALQIAPNPAVDNTTLTMSVHQGGTAAISLSNLNGRILRRQMQAFLPGKNLVTLDQLGGLPAGIYYLQIVCGSELHFEKLVITKNSN